MQKKATGHAAAHEVFGQVHSVESMGLVDGPGIRTIFFLQGCPLRCAYCHNPDTQCRKGGQRMSSEELVRRARRFRSYHGSKGGVTFSGGEPLLQGEFLLDCLKRLKKEGVNTCVDTSGFGDRRYYSDLFPLVDTLLLDVKAFTEEAFQDLVEGNMKELRHFMATLEENGFRGRIWIRHVMLPGYTDSEEAMKQLVKVIRPIAHLVDRIEILPYHTMGREKYRELNRPYRLEGLAPMDHGRAGELQKFANHWMEAEHFRLQQEGRNRQMTGGPRYDRRYLTDREKQEQQAVLRRMPLLSEVAEESWDSVWKHIRLFWVEKGHFLFCSGDSADMMYIICRGHVKIYYNTADGREQIYYIYDEGDFVGGLNILNNASYLYMGETLEDSLIASVPKDVFDRYFLNNPQTLRRLLKKSFERIRWAEDLIQRLSTNNATMKVAALLIRLQDSFGVETEEGVRLDLSMNREEMGNYSGMTRETITRKLGEFKELGYIDYTAHKSIILKDVEGLRRLIF
ncbi:MAG: pyruvate formate-lyase-activating protein [Ndongobacter sp.]|nr:pyruvate formate-lyase-activating protein [Ndongobacter sp.]